MTNLNNSQFYKREERIFIIYKYYIYKSINLDKIDTEFLSDYNFDKNQIIFLKKIFDKLFFLENEIKKYLPDNWSWERFFFIEKSALINAAAEILIGKNKKSIVIDSTLNFSKKYSGLSAKSLLNGIIDKIGN